VKEKEKDAGTHQQNQSKALMLEWLEYGIRMNSFFYQLLLFGAILKCRLWHVIQHWQQTSMNSFGNRFQDTGLQYWHITVIT
jgi:hypothetical protein